MMHMWTRAILTGVLSVASTAGLQVHAQDDVPTVDNAAKPIVEHINKFYRGLTSVSCAGEVHVKLGEGTVDDRISMRGRAVRPNKIAVISIEPHGYFPTNQFVSNGNRLFEWSIRRRMFMISKAAPNFQELFHRAATRSAPNMPVEVFLALLSDQPVQDLLRLDVEPGLIRLVGQTQINGVLCHELVVNERGSRAWFQVDSPPWLMRYRNSPKIALPRYLPKGSIVTGPSIQIDFKSWLMTPPVDEKWDWVVPEGNTQMATMHESNKGGPEDGYTSLLLEPGKPAGADAPGNTAPTEFQVRPGVTVPDSKPLGPPNGSLAPEVELISIGGTRSSLSSIRKDRPAVLVFWLNKEKFSRTSIPKLLNAMKPLTGKVAIIPIASGSDEASVLAVAKRNNAFAGSYVDAGGVVADRFDVAKTPAVIILNREGKVVETFIGPTPNLSNLTVRICERLLKAPVTEKAPTEDSEAPKKSDDGRKSTEQ